MRKLFLLFVAMVLTLSQAVPVFASDLEVVEEDKPVAAQEAPKAEIAAVAPLAVEEFEVVPEAPVPMIEKAKDDTTPASKKKVMPLPPAVATIAPSEPTRYTVGPDDVIEIVVRRHPEFSGQYPINAEGKIQYKFVGDIEIKGLSKTEVKDKISQILSKFVINPEVDVTILEYRSKVIYVIGEVGGPGKYYMKADQISLREAVVQAGLPTLSAAMRRTQLIRPDKTGKPKILIVDLYALLYEGKLNLDKVMFPGDVLVVPATFFAKVMRIISPVASPVLTSDSVRRVGTGGF